MDLEWLVLEQGFWTYLRLLEAYWKLLNIAFI